MAPLWFVWDGTALWLNSVVRSQRWTDLELSGAVAVVGDVPRTATPEPALAVPVPELPDWLGLAGTARSGWVGQY